MENLNSKKHNRGFYEKYIKRLLDIILSFLALVLLSPILLVLSIAIKIKLGSPIIFKQKRPGLNGQIFNMYKFRTMTDDKDKNGNLLPDEDRMTNFGKKIRDTSLDELPELFCILMGTLSVCGPRPLLVSYLPLYNNHQKRRHEVRPGLTGLAQVNGRNSITWEEKFDLDVEYVDHVTFLGDCKIIIQTIKTVFTREGISSKTSVTMEPFKGNLSSCSEENNS